MGKSASLECPKNNRKSWWMYPDIFSIAFTAEAYYKHWSRLQLSKRMTITGMLPIPAKQKYFGFSSETIHPIKMKMAIQKLLYFGYLNGFNCPEKIDFSMKIMETYNLSSTFLMECQKTRNNVSSGLLQNELMEFYKENAKILMDDMDIPPVIAYFGESYLIVDETQAFDSAVKLFDNSEREIQTFIQLDPQEPPLNVERYICIHDTLPGTTLRELLKKNSLSFFSRKLDIWDNDEPLLAGETRSLSQG